MKRSTAYFIIFLVLVFFAQTTAIVYAQSAKKQKGKKAKREICITFDELPASKGFGEIDREAVNYLILQALKKHKVKATGFVIGEWVEDSYDILGQWLNEGHSLGNLTFSNQDFNGIDSKNFLNDIRMGNKTLEPMLSGFGQKERYFRYPYLHYGIDVKSRRAIENFLDAGEISVAHASIVVDDYLYNLSLDKLGKIPDSAKYEALLNDYLNHVFDEIERVEHLSKTIMRRPCRQILQLRANRINAVFLEEMLTAMEEMGFTFIPLSKALSDKVYRMDHAYFDMRGIGYLDMIINSNPDLLPAE